MNARIADLVCLVLVAVPVALAVWLWPALPDPMPSHWNASGEVDGYLPKFWGVALLPMIAAGTWLIMKLIPHISPKGFRTDDFISVVRLFQVVIVAFMAFISVLVLLEANGAGLAMDTITLAGTGLLLMIIGNFMTKVRKNFFIGIRTPWTLASDEVWNRTHRLGGWLFVLGGAIMLLGAIVGLPVEWLIGAVLVTGLYPVLHSFLLYRRLEGFGEDSPPDA